MDNYNEYDLACDVLAHTITDRDFVAVKSLLLAAASLDVDSVVDDICKLIDRITGCGLTFILIEVRNIHRKFFN